MSETLIPIPGEAADDNDGNVLVSNEEFQKLKDRSGWLQFVVTTIVIVFFVAFVSFMVDA